jgi:hypothetical protein
LLASIDYHIPTVNHADTVFADDVNGPSMQQALGSHRPPRSHISSSPLVSVLVEPVQPGTCGEVNKGSIGEHSSKAQRLALQQALKQPELFSVAVRPVGDSVVDFDDSYSLATFHEDDSQSITTIDSRMVLPGPTVDMVRKSQKARVVSSPQLLNR